MQFAVPRTFGLAALVCLLTSAPLGAQGKGRIAVIVNRDNPVTGLSIDNLQRLFLGSKTSFDGGERVVLAEAVSARAGFYDALLQQSEDQVKRHWIALVFSGETGNPPRDFDDAAALKKFVATHKGAIAFVPASDVDATVKLLAIAGKPPRNNGYEICSGAQSC